LLLTSGGVVTGRLGQLPGGRYRLSFTLAGRCVVGTAIATLEVTSGTSDRLSLGSATVLCETPAADAVAPSSHELALEFDAAADPIRYQLTSSTTSKLELTSAMVVRTGISSKPQ
jgi:hypothetical protein